MQPERGETLDDLRIDVVGHGDFDEAGDSQCHGDFPVGASIAGLL
jgi:hypothetical protein